jgi:branched-chain amino acid transport system substrate-binding protein
MAANSDSSMSRRDLLRGIGMGAGGLVIGGAAGYLGGHSSSGSSNGNSNAQKGKPILVGSGSPVTGFYSSDGQDMIRGQQLAISEINARGGINGRPLQLSILDTQNQQPDVMSNVFRKFVSEGVAAVFAGFTTYSSVEFPIIADAGMPMFHVNTWHGNVDFVKQHKIINIFQGDPTEVWYGPGLVKTVQHLISKNLWKPSASKSVAIITSNDPYSLAIANGFKSSISKLGWKISMFQQFTVPQADWTATLVNIRNNPPDIIFFSDYAASDEASFIKQFRQSPTKSLVYEQYAPSIPEYLTLAGSAADGVLWSTVIGVVEGDAVSNKFAAAYEKKFNASPGYGNAGDQYDLMNIWANADAEAGDPYDFKSVNSIIKDTIYRGVCGAYSWPDDYLTVYPYPDYTSDPSVGMPHLTFQIQNGKQVLVGPDPYATGTFQLPSWMV